MKRLLIAVVTVGAALSATVTQASLDFGALPGSQLEFGPGSTFSVTGSIVPSVPLGANAQWDITSPGPAVSLEGIFTGGPWTYGGITINGTDQTASVATKPGTTFEIADGSGDLAVGNVNWVTISTSAGIGGVNGSAVVNITGMTYSGSNLALKALVADSAGSVNMSFQFIPAKTLTQLSATTSAFDTSYSGTFAPVPEPTTIVAGFLLLVPLCMSTLRILRRNQLG